MNVCMIYLCTLYICSSIRAVTDTSYEDIFILKVYTVYNIDESIGDLWYGVHQALDIIYYYFNILL